jgi:hypothetical protein
MAWMNFSLTAAANGRITPPVMANIERLAGLSDASGYLLRARAELLSAGYGLWTGALIELLDAIALEVEWLSSEEAGPGTMA